MGLFTNPVTLNDGVADHIFIFRGQLPDTKSIVTQYIETAAIAAGSKLTVKQDVSSKTVKRGLVQHTVNIAGTDAIQHPITVNLTVMCHPTHNAVDVEKRVKLLVDACAEAGFYANFVAGLT